MTVKTETDSEETHDHGARNVAYSLLVFLMLINVLNIVDRQLLHSLANYIIDDLKLSNAEFGLLAGIVFTLFYSIGGIIIGALADRTHRPRLLAAGLAMWSILTAVSGKAVGFWSMFFPRLFIGVGESTATPTSLSMLADRFPQKQLGFASGFYYLGVPIGAAGSLLVGGYLAPLIGWRGCFYLLGAIGLGFAAALLFLPETPRKGAVMDAQGKHVALPFLEILKTIFSTLKKSPALVCIIAAGTIYHIAIGAAAFDQPWFVKEHGFDKAEILVKAGWIAAPGGILGSLLGGWLGDEWQKRFASGRAMFLFWTSIILLPFFVIYRMSDPDSPFFWLGIFLGFFQLGLFYGPSFATVQELAPARIRASIIAFFILNLNLLGLGIGSFGTGKTIDMLIAAGHPQPYTLALIIFTLIAALSIPLFYIAGKRFHKDKDAMAQDA